MEQRTRQGKKLSRNEKRAVKQIAVQTVKQTVQRPQPQQKPRKNKNRNRSRKGRKGKVSLKQKFLDAMLYPDMVGPIRFPREGTSSRTNLAYTSGVYFMTPDATNPYKGAQLGTLYDSISYDKFEAATSSSAFTKTGCANAVSAPISSSIDDCNLTHGCITMSYEGEVAKASGEILLYLGPAISNLVNYDEIRYFPGTRIISCAELLNSGKVRVSLTHVSPSSWEFIAPNVSGEDFNTPAVFWTGGVTGTSICIEVTKFFEYRAKAKMGAALPYSVSDKGFSNDLNALTDASAQLGSTLNTATSGEDWSMLNYLPHSVTGIATLAGTGLGIRGINRWGNNIQELPSFANGMGPYGPINQGIVRESLEDVDSEIDVRGDPKSEVSSPVGNFRKLQPVRTTPSMERRN